jgi:hypothetical protein
VIATTARFVYGENYTCFPMRHYTKTGGLGRRLSISGKLAADGAALGSGRTLKRDLMAMPAHFMGADSQPFFKEALRARSWPMARPSLFSWGIKFNEAARS